jgi:hypothetical protein
MKYYFKSNGKYRSGEINLNESKRPKIMRRNG